MLYNATGCHAYVVFDVCFCTYLLMILLLPFFYPFSQSKGTSVKKVVT